MYSTLKAGDYDWLFQLNTVPGLLITVHDMQHMHMAISYCNKDILMTVPADGDPKIQ